MPSFKQISNYEEFEMAKKQFKEGSEIRNPCLAESKMSLKCLDENMYDRDKCEEYFENYRNCKHFWSYVSRDRRSKGIWPQVPLPEDREAVKKEYLKKITIKK